MVARIKFSSSLSNVLNYNENKLKQNKAEFIHASGFVKDTDKLGFSEKFRRLQKQMQLNETRKKSVAHISLNFDKTEKLDRETLKKIADAYMKKIGFGNQPYLVYQHHDAAHPHIHIVSTIIKNDGNPIETHNIGKNFSEPARKEIEKLFGLIEADKHQQKEVFQLSPISAQKIQYGKSETKRAITNVLDVVLKSYKYTSLSELNAVLKQYNVVADAGTENSRLQKNKGLVYRVLDENGNKIGAPVKASAIYNNPGLKFLEPEYLKNEELRKPFKQRLKNAIDLVLKRSTVNTVDEFQKALQREKIQVVVRTNSDGRIYGLTYVDHQSKCVFNGSDLGKVYSATGVEERLLKEKEIIKHEAQRMDWKETITKETSERHSSPRHTKHQKPALEKELNTTELSSQLDKPNELLKELIKPEYAESIPADFKRKRKRKKKRLHL